MNKWKKVAVAGAVASVVMGGVIVTLEPASAYSVCDDWHDANTYGGVCHPGGSWRAVARCNNGQTVYGAVVGSNQWSYAYCDGKGGYSDGSGGMQAQ